MSEILGYMPEEEKEKPLGLRDLIRKYTPGIGHAHTTFSNPENRHEADYTIEQIRGYAQEKMTSPKGGVEFIVIAEHPSDAGNPELVDGQALLENHRQIKEVAKQNENGPEIISGVETSIIGENGEVDVPNEVLGQMDLVIASKHDLKKAFPPDGKPTPEQLTRVYAKLMENPQIDIIGHPNRYISDKDNDPNTPLKQMDWDALITAARETNTALEINFGAPMPQWLIEKAIKGGAPIFIGTDAHTLEQYQKLTDEEKSQIETADDRLDHELKAGIAFWRRRVYGLLKIIDDAKPAEGQVITSSKENLKQWFSREKAERSF